MPSGTMLSGAPGRIGKSIRQTHMMPLILLHGTPSRFELAQDWEIVDFLTAGTDKAKLLVRSLQSCLQWYGQTEIDEILGRMRIMSMIN